MVSILQFLLPIDRAQALAPCVAFSVWNALGGVQQRRQFFESRRRLITNVRRWASKLVWYVKWIQKTWDCPKSQCFAVGGIPSSKKISVVTRRNERGRFFNLLPSSTLFCFTTHQSVPSIDSLGVLHHLFPKDQLHACSQKPSERTSSKMLFARHKRRLDHGVPWLRQLFHVYQYVLAAARTMNNMIAKLIGLNSYIDAAEAATQSIRAGEHSRSMDGTKATTVRPATTKRSAADNGTTTPLQLIYHCPLLSSCRDDDLACSTPCGSAAFGCRKDGRDVCRLGPICVVQHAAAARTSCSSFLLASQRGHWCTDKLRALSQSWRTVLYGLLSGRREISYYCCRVNTCRCYRHWVSSWTMERCQIPSGESTPNHTVRKQDDTCSSRFQVVPVHLGGRAVDTLAAW